MQRRTYHFTGHVQGVGFRYTAQSLAKSRPVTGYVRNLSDGRVEMIAEGSQADLDELLSALQEKMEGKIKRVDVNSAPATGEFHGFEVRH